MSEPPLEIRQDPRWELAQRMAASRHFSRAAQLHDFLLFITLRKLEGREHEIHETNIGCSVLGRDELFSPITDNIVRVQARHLRRKVEEYFANEGRDEPLILSIPKGGYVPHFEPRPAAPVAGLVETPPPDREVNPKRWRWAAGGVAAGLLAAALWLGLGALPAKGTNPVLSALFRDGQVTNIVVADSCLALIQDILRTDVTLSEYTAPGFQERMLALAPNAQVRTAVELLFSRQYTSLGDLSVASQLSADAARYPGLKRVRYARHLSLREFKSENFILIGSRRAIPWGGLFEAKLNFQPVWDRTSGAYYFQNRSARQGESESYGTAGNGGKETFATVTLMRNPDGAGNVLLLNGLTMEGTEAAGEYVLDSTNGKALGTLYASSGKRNFAEVLLRVTVEGGIAREPRIQASRTKPRE